MFSKIQLELIKQEKKEHIHTSNKTITSAHSETDTVVHKNTYKTEKGKILL